MDKGGEALGHGQPMKLLVQGSAKIYSFDEMHEGVASAGVDSSGPKPMRKKEQAGVLGACGGGPHERSLALGVLGVHVGEGKGKLQKLDGVSLGSNVQEGSSAAER